MRLCGSVRRTHLGSGEGRGGRGRVRCLHAVPDLLKLAMIELTENKKGSLLSNDRHYELDYINERRSAADSLRGSRKTI
jgi:hypothetical protein